MPTGVFGAAVLLLLVSNVVAAVGPAAAPTPGPEGSILYPPRSRALDFRHGVHVKHAKCVDCHAEVPDSRRASDRLVPGEERCVGCHEVQLGPTRAAPETPPDLDRAGTLCGGCHPAYRLPGGAPRFPPGLLTAGRVQVLNPPPRSSYPTPYLRFSHAAHARGGIGCGVCHDGVEAAEVNDRVAPLPRMNDCLRCHDGRRASEACATCHLTDGAGRVRTRLPVGRLIPTGASFDDAHDDAFVRGHGPAATRSRRHCESCHAPTQCQSCHDARVRPEQVHPGNWIALHGVPARKDPRGCAACHRSQSSCIRCHRRSHVVAEGEQRFPSDRSFHPTGWTLGGGEAAGPNRHGREARRNLRACTSCHQEKSCLRCHRSASFGGVVSVNPHGRGFVGRCGALMRRASRVCYRCHDEGDAALDRCR